MKFKVTPEDFLKGAIRGAAESAKWKVSPEDFLKPLKAGKVDLSRYRLPKAKRFSPPKVAMPGRSSTPPLPKSTLSGNPLR